MAEQANQNDTFMVRIQGRIEGQETINVHYFRCIAGGGDPDVALNLIQALLDCFIQNLLPVLTSSWTLERIIWQKVFPVVGRELVSIPQGNAAGQGPAQALPSYCSAVFSKLTQFGGKSKRGRMYLPGIPEAATIGSTLDPNHAFWAGLIAFALCFVNKFVAGDPPGSNTWQAMLYSRKLGGSSLPLGNAGFESITEFVPSSLLGTTRSRKVGRGS